MKNNDLGNEGPKGSSKGIVRGVALGGSVAVLLLALGYVLLMREPDVSEPPPVVDPSSDVTSVEKATFTNEESVVEVEAPKEVDPNARPTKVGEVVNGYRLLPSGRMHKVSGVITNSIANRPKGAYEIFEHHCENEIACYLTLKPGDTLVGPRRYTGKFKEQFLKSLETPIVINEDDTPEQVQLKEDVAAAKQELKEALDRGEDIEQIMIDTREELQSLMVYKMEMRRQFHELLKECETDEQVEELFDSCNKMLAEKGIAPLTFGPITRRNFLRGQE